MEGLQDGQRLERLACEERLRDWGLFTLEKEWLQGGLTAALQYLKRGYRKDVAKLFTEMYNRIMRVNSHKLV